MSTVPGVPPLHRASRRPRARGRWCEGHRAVRRRQPFAAPATRSPGSGGPPPARWSARSSSRWRSRRAAQPAGGRRPHARLQAVRRPWFPGRFSGRWAASSTGSPAGSRAGSSRATTCGAGSMGRLPTWTCGRSATCGRTTRATRLLRGHRYSLLVTASDVRARGSSGCRGTTGSTASTLTSRRSPTPCAPPPRSRSSSSR